MLLKNQMFIDPGGRVLPEKIQHISGSDLVDFP
jgi:hypothetical protein